MFDLSKLDTGDIILFSSQWSWNPISWFAKAIEYFTDSPYSHIGIILRDPVYIDSDLRGLYLWESSFNGTPDPQDGNIKLGVQITLMKELLKSRHETIWWRKINCPSNKFTVFNIMKTHDEVYKKPYDFMPKDWIEAYNRQDADPQKLNRLFCSALAACIYTKCKVLIGDTDWSIVRPSDFAIENDGKYIHFQDNCSLDKMIQIKP